MSARCRFDAAARELAEYCAEHEPAFEPDADTALGYVDDALIRDYALLEPALIGEALACVDEDGFWTDLADPELLGARVRLAVYAYVAACLAREAQGIEVYA